MFFKTQKNISDKPSASEVRLSIAVVIGGAFFVCLGTAFWFGNAFALGMGAPSTNLFVWLIFSGLPYLIIGTACFIAMPIILHKKWLLYCILGTIAIILAWLFTIVNE